MFSCVPINTRNKGFCAVVEVDLLLKVYLRFSLVVSHYFLCAAQTFGSPQQPQQNPLLPAIQACIDAITEHQRLNSLMKGELIKGLLPQSSVRADYTVQRVQGEYLAFAFFSK